MLSQSVDGLGHTLASKVSCKSQKGLTTRARLFDSQITVRKAAESVSLPINSFASDTINERQTGHRLLCK